MDRLFELLKQRGLFDRMLIVVLSDHGEEFLEHGDFGHGPSVYQELTRVPLLVRLPEGAHGGRVIHRPVALIDVAPTVLDWIGLEIPEVFEGRSLRGVMQGSDPGEWLDRRPIYVDVPNVRRPVRGLRRGRWKLIRNVDRSELYDLTNDPSETRNLARKHPKRLAELETQLDQWLIELRHSGAERGTLAVPSSQPHPVEQEANLRALGYIE